jgi:hypothetical protein
MGGISPPRSSVLPYRTQMPGYPSTATEDLTSRALASMLGGLGVARRPDGHYWLFAVGIDRKADTPPEIAKFLDLGARWIADLGPKDDLDIISRKEAIAMIESSFGPWVVWR